MGLQVATGDSKSTDKSEVMAPPQSIRQDLNKCKFDSGVLLSDIIMTRVDLRSAEYTANFANKMKLSWSSKVKSDPSR